MRREDKFRQRFIRMGSLLLFLLSFLYFTSNCRSTSGDDYRRVLERWKRSKKRLTYEISRQAQGREMSIEERSHFTSALSDDYVEVKVTFQTPELINTYIEMVKENKELSSREVNSLRKELYLEYDLENSLCFTIEINNKSKSFTYLYLKPIADKILIKDNYGQEYKPVKWDEDLNQAMSSYVKGKIFFPLHNKLGKPVIGPQTKWIKLVISQIFPLNYLPFYGNQPDFEFIFPMVSDAFSYHFFQEDEASDLQKLINKGVKAYKKRDIEEAINLWEKAIDINPESIIVYNLLGTAYLERKLFDAAIQILRIAIEIDPLSSLSHYNLGLAYYQKKEWEKAEVEFMQAIAINYYYVAAHYYLGLTYEQKMQFKQAKEEYKIVLELQEHHQLAQEGLLRITKNRE